MPTPSISIQEASASLVYVARCLVSGKSYVGVTSRGLRERRRKHISRALAGSNLRFHRALRKYGPDLFTWEERYSNLSWKDACRLEQSLIAELQTRNARKGYNDTDGGEGALGMSLSSEVRAQIGVTLKAWHASSPEAQALRETLSALKTGTRASLATRVKLAERNRGRRLSEASRAKLSQSKLLYPDGVRRAAALLAKEFGVRPIARFFGVPPITVQRWAKSPEEMALERAATLERNRTRQYGYAFPT